MKTLLVLRHAKSPHPADVDDHDRPLFPGARGQIADLARQLADRGLIPGTVLSSDAVRAADTARAYSLAVAAVEPVLLGEFYEPGAPEDMLEAIQDRGGETGVVLVVGHNPGMEEFCNLLTKRPEVDRLGTGTLAVFEVGIDSWSELRFKQARLKDLIPSH
jgi:phosphohistidine phosphatase